MTAANNLFKKSFQRVIRSPKVFFDTTPIGRVLSRFSKDQDVLDSALMQVLSSSLEMLFGIISIFVSYPILLSMLTNY
jgi:ATP-binding cassette subfamily C (CFTR/MRP) protein 1